MLLRVGDEGQREEVDELLLVAQRRALAVEKVPNVLQTLRGGRQVLGDFPAAKIDVQPEVDLGVRRRVVHVWNQSWVVPYLEIGKHILRRNLLKCGKNSSP